MKKTILYTLSIIAAIAIAVFTVFVGCDGDFGERSEKMDAFLDKFHYNRKVVKKFTITYDGNGATGKAPIDEKSPYDSGEVVIIMDKGELKNGNAVFSKWNSQPDGKGKYSCVYKSPFQLNENVIFYAQWDTSITFEVKVESSLAGTLVYGSGNSKPGDPVIITAGTPPDGWKFQEWTTASSGVFFADANSASTSFIMPGNKVTVKAEFVYAAGGKIGLLKDERDGKTYTTVTIDKQTWMAQNLDYEPETGSWCYDNDPDNCAIYGRLYTRYVAKNVCPAGWRLPDTADWNRLVNAAGGANVAGKKLKSKTGWNGGSSTDEYGFSALPGGHRRTDGSFYNAGEYGHWWTATEYGGGNAYYQNMYYDNVYEGSNDVGYGFSVRCREDG
jgi:uncharacterized protein (TIGR02145 family)